MNEQEPNGFVARLKVLQASVPGQSIAELARHLDAPISSVRSWLLGENDPSRANLVRIAQAYGCSVGWLAAGEGPMQTEQQEADFQRQRAFMLLLMAVDLRPALTVLAQSARPVVDRIMAGDAVSWGDVLRLKHNLAFAEDRLRAGDGVVIQVRKDDP